MKKKIHLEYILLGLLVLLFLGSLAFFGIMSSLESNNFGNEIQVSEMSAKSSSDIFCSNIGGIWCYWPSWAFVANVLWIIFLLVLIFLLLRKLVVG